MANEITITLAGKDYTIRKHTLRQQRDIAVVLAEYEPAKALENTVAVLSAALARDHGEVTADTILNSETTMTELDKACAAVLRHAGFTAAPQPDAEGAPAAA
jgi:hypothetical protein